ncbi:MAG TPA: 4a-hydroxytetrahydrobiopterin dehydratase [Gallionella sp.]|nr:4a-hydroxytetrahydrobiopterin dehydratase [Gallionella sp.]
MNDICDLTSKRCKPCEGGTPALTQPEVDSLMTQLTGWQQYGNLIGKTYHFKNYYQTIAFVNAVAWMAHHEDHHPELTVGYNSCHVEYTTHAMHGLSENDFICAAKVDALLEP